MRMATDGCELLLLVLHIHKVCIAQCRSCALGRRILGFSDAMADSKSALHIILRTSVAMAYTKVSLHSS